MTFYKLGLDRPILEALAIQGYEQPTVIQSKAIPPILDGRDVVGLAQTGTGKTAAFTLPLLHRLARTTVRQDKHRPVRVLVLSPTRELAAQIHKAVRDYGRKLPLRSVCITGGVSPGPQRKALAAGVDIVIATPGRLLDLADQRALRLDQVETLVLDEADHMLDIGFMPAIRRIVSLVPAKRQTLLFSATMPKEIRKLSAEHLHQPVEVSAAPKAVTADKIEQSLMHLAPNDKVGAVAALAHEHAGKRIIVFTRTKRGADKVVRQLGNGGINAAAIHGNKSQGQRERALAAFRKGNCPVLVATDIAARGIDVPDIAMVINFELPNVPEVYIHRIGRTARAGACGLAVSLCAPDERICLRDIERLLRRQIEVVAAPTGTSLATPDASTPVPPAAKSNRNRPHSNRRPDNRNSSKRNGPPRKRRRRSNARSRAA